MQNETLEKEDVVVRTLRPADLEGVIRIDAKNVGSRREQYFQIKLDQNLAETGIKISLAAELDGAFVGFLLCRVHYGEFGVLEPAAILDTFGVDPLFQGRGVGHALMRQLRMNLSGLGVGELRSEVRWEDAALMNYFRREGFLPAPRICLSLKL